MQPTPNSLLTIDELAAILSCSRSHIRRLWHVGTLPAPIRLGRRSIRWRVADLQEFVESQTPVTHSGNEE